MANRTRYIESSCRKHFADKMPSFPTYYEHTNPKNLTGSDGKPITSYYEYRLDGPYRRNLPCQETWYYIEINILIHSIVDPTYSDRVIDMIDEVSNAFTSFINVLAYIDTDPPQYVGCLELLQDETEQVHVNRFAQANPDTKMLQASVEGHYRMKLWPS